MTASVEFLLSYRVLSRVCAHQPASHLDENAILSISPQCLLLSISLSLFYATNCMMPYSLRSGVSGTAIVFLSVTFGRDIFPVHLVRNVFVFVFFFTVSGGGDLVIKKGVREMKTRRRRTHYFIVFGDTTGKDGGGGKRIWDGMGSTDRTCACSSNCELTMDLIVQSIL
jgi:hypothetical protein